MTNQFFVYPITGNKNPYISNLITSLCKHYNHMTPNKWENRLPPVIALFRASFKSDIFIINWLESVAFSKFSLFQTLVAVLSVWIIIIRGKRIVWIFHNIIPHEGINRKSLAVRSLLFKESSLIVAHSKEAYEYVIQRTRCQTVYKSHPVMMPKIEKHIVIDEDYDVLYWGDIYEYKGVDRFVEMLNERGSKLRVKIIGRCKDENLKTKIIKNCNNYISYDEEFADYALISAYISKSKYIVFPYVGNSISSSGVLIDTLMLGGNIVGPEKGAFKDLGCMGLCLTYNNLDHLFAILHSNSSVDKTKIDQFLKENSWEYFSDYLYNILTR